ncbi:MAG: DUF4249 domain-containing protein [Bacteroidales bacterium]|nr:DUF4249 domain-containing protein [Bacteroidales bacterium]MCF8344793.1 DUF4249 domain-containing protein [Bacteroidales bacterium]MCF8351775.1 DUF4249 domain-containing protein [Bacteroidales bacterium]MCF8375586.1 DUF4249 domain-containing protein [Bacteroidales bacterium]
MKTIHKICLALLIAVTAFSCTERIDIELDDTYTRLVVEGYMTTEANQNYIRLTKTTSYFYGEQPPAVRGATVIVSDGDTSWQLTERAKGIYRFDPPVAGKVGKVYTLNIVLAEALSEQTEYTASSRINPINEIDSIAVAFRNNWNFWEVKCYAQDPPSTEFYMFRILKNGMMVTDSIDEVMVVDDVLYNGSYTNGIGIGWLDERRADERLRIGDTVEVLMSSITEGYTDFVWTLQEESGYQNPLFGGPPANVQGNISNGALGYFAAYSNTRASTTVNVTKD